MAYTKTKLFLTVLLSGFLAVSPAKAQVISKDAVIVCRSKQCKPARDMMTREFLHNKLASLLENNINRRILFCDADPMTHVCLSNAIDFNVQAGVTGGVAEIISAKVVDAKVTADQKALNFILDYKIALNNTYPECQGALNQLTVASPDYVSIETPGFECRFTGNGITVLNASYFVDYIDFDYGILGASYTVGVGQTSKGGKAGYALLRFSEPANPNNDLIEGCDCECDDEQTPPCQCEETKTIVQEKVVTEYEVAPIEVIVKTKAPIDGSRTQDFKINGVTVPNVPVVVEGQPTAQAEASQMAEPVTPTITENMAEAEVKPGEVLVISTREQML